MRTSESIAAIAADLVKAQAELKNAPMDKENPHFKSRYASLESVRDTVTPILAKHGIAVVQSTESTEGGNVTLATRLLHSSGEWLESSYPVAFDKPQQMGSAISYGRRYMLSAMCSIASEEDDDGNAAQKGGDPREKKSNGSGVSVDQLRDLAQTGKSMGVAPEAMTEYVKEKYGVDSVRNLTETQFQDLRAWVVFSNGNQEEASA